MKMEIHSKLVLCLLFLSVIGDISNVLNPGQSENGQFLSHRPVGVFPGAEAVLGHVARGVAAVAKRLAAGHKKNKRPSNKNKHEKGDSRRQRDQERAKERKKKGK